MAKLSNPNVTDEQIIAVYQECLSAYKVADVLDVSNKRVYRVLGKAGIKPEGLQRYREGAMFLSREQQAEIARLYADGARTEDLMERFGASHHSIRQAVLRSGGEMRPMGGNRPRKQFSDKEIAEICRMYESGMSQTAIGGVVGASQAVISRALRAVNTSMREDYEGRGRYQGGRMKAGPYVRVLLPADDPFAAMRDRAGYVLEHRLVIARALGRPLLDSETVHHINGDHADNQLENLQLRQGRHGKGVVMCCLDCGSRRVVPCEVS